MTILFQNSDPNQIILTMKNLLFGSSKVPFTIIIYFFNNNKSIDKAIGGFWNT